MNRQKFSLFSPLLSVLLVVITSVAGLSAASAERLGSPAIHDGHIYIGSDSGKIRAIDISSGRLLWTHNVGGLSLLRPVIDKGQLFAGGESGFMHALDVKTGQENWRFEAGKVSHPIRDRYVNSIPSISGDYLYFTSEDFNLYAVHTQTGEEIWRFNLGEEVQQVETPLVNGNIYVGSWNGHIFAIDAESGKEIWRSDTNNYHKGTIGISSGEQFVPDGPVPEGERKSSQVPYVTVSPLIDGDRLYFVDWSGNLFGIDIKTGKQKIRFKPDTLNSKHVGSRFYMSQTADRIIYATLEDRHLYSVDKKTGERVSELVFDGWIEGPIPVSDHQAFLLEYELSDEGTPDGLKLHGFNPDQMNITYTVENVAFLPTVEGRYFYVPTAEAIEMRDLNTGELIKVIKVRD